MKIAILGSTGSIGTQTIQVVRELNSRKETDCNPHIQIIALAAGSNVDALAKQAVEFDVKILSVKFFIQQLLFIKFNYIIVSL